MNCFLLALAAGTALTRKYMAVFARQPQKSGRNWRGGRKARFHCSFWIARPFCVPDTDIFRFFVDDSTYRITDQVCDSTYRWRDYWVPGRPLCWERIHLIYTYRTRNKLSVKKMAYHSVFWVKQSDRLTWATDSLNQLPMGVLQISSQTGMIEWGQKSKPPKTPWASNKTTPKIPGQNFTSKKSHAEFPSHKNFQKALKKTRKMETSVWIPKKLPPKIPKWKISNPQKSFDHPCHLKSGVPPSGAREVRYKSRKPVITSKQYFKGYRCLPY